MTKLVIPSCVRSPCVSRNSRFSVSFSKAVELMYFGKRERVWQVCCCGFAARAPPALCSSPSRGSHGVWTQFSLPGRLVCAAATSGSPFAAVRMLVLMLEGFFFPSILEIALLFPPAVSLTAAFFLTVVIFVCVHKNSRKHLCRCH